MRFSVRLAEPDWWKDKDSNDTGGEILLNSNQRKV
jgi:hypothetical protein